MSDSIEELARRYVEDVHAEQHPRSIGLFPIPEYPELEGERGMWSAALETILTTLRYLAPATLLTLFWGQQSFLFTLLKHIDNAFRAIIFSSEEQKQAVLQWLGEAGPVRVEHLDTVWRHGWILCRVLDGHLPGACAGHPPTRLSLKHAQHIADHYLGVEPVFSRQELESNDSLSRHQEWRLATYLDRVREALLKIPPPVSKPTSQRTSPETGTTQFTIDYVAKGSGLTAAQVHHKMSFKVYPTAQQALDPGEITILIRGPKDIYGMTVLPPILGKAQKIRQKLLGLESKQTFTENALPITQGATYLRSYGKNDMNKTYHIPKTVYAIEIEATKREDHTKVLYTVPLEGKYEISITSRGQNIVGSPFLVKASTNIIGILEKESFCLEDGEEIDIVDVKTDRKVVLRIVDFVTEKMLLRENGVLEKITEDEAKLLMSTDVENERSSSVTEIIDHVSTKSSPIKSDRFNQIAQRVLKLNRACKAFDNARKSRKEKLLQPAKEETALMCTRNQKDIPDVVNSTLSDANITPFMVTEKKDKYIIPASISVSIRTEKAKPIFEGKLKNLADVVEEVQLIARDHSMAPCSPDSLDKISEEEQQEDDNVSIDRMTPLSSNNPFLTDACEDFTVEKKLGTYVKTEFERNNSQNEETRDSSIKIVVEENDTPSPLSIANPFFETDARMLERPKTPVYKIITGDVSNRVDSPYLDPKNELLSEEMLSNEFVNPFFVHQLQSTNQYKQTPQTDFIIGAPVSLPPIIRAPSPEPMIEALVTTKRRTSNFEVRHDDEKTEFSSPVQTLPKGKEQTTVTSTFHSLESSFSDPIDNSNASTSSDNQFEPYRVASKSSRDVSPRKDIWDSAYVSIDDSSGSPDNNNNENATITDTTSKQKFSFSDNSFEQQLSKMGPAERELWETCGELNETHKLQDEAKTYRYEIKRPMFTPIIEESDRSISSGMKESLKHIEADPVTVAFAELNDIYQEYYPNTENNSTLDSGVHQHTEVEHMIETDDTGVKSASDASDMIRHKPEQEGTISEVQTNVTESVSVSQPLRNKISDYNHALLSHNKIETQFGDKISNIVLEKKKYWDEKIRQIEAKTEETTKHLKKRRTSSKQLKHDSLSKRKGKQIVKNFLNASNEEKVQIIKSVSVNKPEIVNKEPVSEPKEEEKCKEKLVEKWKKYWNDKLESEIDEHENDMRSNSPRCPSKSPQRYKEKPIKNTSDTNKDLKTNLPVKQELPEEVFKAFETSPKRFFGTSRKHILNKIDTFICKPSSPEENASTEIIEVSPDSGLVSSRISLFHNLTNTEPLPWMQSKSQSMHNVLHRKDSENNIAIEEQSVQKQTLESKFSIRNEPIKITTESIASTPEKVSLQNKRARLAQSSFNKSFDEADIRKSSYEENKYITKPAVPKTIKEIHKPTHIDKYKKDNALRKTSISKSEMDIFSKMPVESDDGLDKHKSYDELPKINVKRFISLYENVSKPSGEILPKPVKRIHRPCSIDSQNHWQLISVNSDAEKKTDEPSHSRLERRSTSRTPEDIPRAYSRSSKVSESTSIESGDIRTDTESLDIYVKSKCSEGKETTYVSLSDIELEIVESSANKSKESTPDSDGQPHIEYKNRFKQAKQFFQSLEELREDKKPRTLNECEMLLLNKSSESLEDVKPQKRLKKKKKSHSMPSSELAKYWNQMQETKKEEPKESAKLIKISEKFNVEDLFSDVLEGRLSRQGSLRGIPHKKAVLEAFRSMENISDSKMSSYEVDISQSEFSNENLGRNAQSYLREYPYLPTTDPSKFHSRLDAKASGLITLKELLEKKGRRNSVPDLRLNAKFSADL